MLEKILYAGILAGACVAHTGCANSDKNRAESAAQATLDTASVERKENRCIMHKYNNGIEASIEYNMGPGDLMSLRIEIMRDPNNVVGQSISASGRPESIIYEIMVDGSRIMKAVTSKIDGTMVRMISNNSDDYMSVGQNGFLIRQPMDPENRKVFGKIEANLDVYGLMQKAKSRDTVSSETKQIF